LGLDVATPVRQHVGAGCRPFAVHAAGLGASTLLVASDGLLRYAKLADIGRLGAGADLDAAVRGLVELARLRSGGLPDVSVVSRGCTVTVGAPARPSRA